MYAVTLLYLARLESHYTLHSQHRGWREIWWQFIWWSSSISTKAFDTLRVWRNIITLWEGLLEANGGGMGISFSFSLSFVCSSRDCLVKEGKLQRVTKSSRVNFRELIPSFKEECSIKCPPNVNAVFGLSSSNALKSNCYGSTRLIWSAGLPSHRG